MVFQELGLFHIVLEEKSQKISLTIIESQNLPNLQNLDVDSQISHFELLDMLPSLLGYAETFKKSCTIIDECTVENERTEIE